MIIIVEYYISYTSICTSNRPALNNASSIKLRLLVNPITNVGTGHSCTPSIFDND